MTKLAESTPSKNGFPLEGLPLELIDNILIHMPLKDVSALRSATPLIWRIYSGEEWEKHLYRRIREIYPILSIAHYIGTIDPNQELDTLLTALSGNTKPTVSALKSMCERLERIDHLITDFSKIALRPTTQVCYRSLPAWTCKQILEAYQPENPTPARTRCCLAPWHASSAPEPLPENPTPARARCWPAPGRVSSAPKPLWDEPSSLSCDEIARLRHAFLYLSIACAVERHVRNYQAGDNEKERLRRMLGEYIPRGLPGIFIEAVSCVYTYLLQRWKRAIEKTREGYGIHTHQTTGDCLACQIHECNVEVWAHRAITHGPEALFTQLDAVSKDSPHDSELETSQHGLLSFLYGGEISTREDYLWPSILKHLQTTLSNSMTGVDTSKQHREMVRAWGKTNALWNMAENRRIISTTRYEDSGDNSTRAWITEWYAHRHVKHHESWALGGLTLRGWVFWEDRRVEKLGWSNAAVVGWLAKGQPGWWDESEKWETINSYAYVITGEPEPGTEEEFILDTAGGFETEVVEGEEEVDEHSSSGDELVTWWESEEEEEEEEDDVPLVGVIAGEVPMLPSEI